MENRCVCCGAVIPEGRMVCRLCELEAEGLMMKRRERAADG